MRWIMVLSAMVFVGCGGNDNPGTGGNGNDMAVGAAGDMAMGGGARTCNPLTQDCPSGQKCAPKFTNAQMTAVTGICVTNGTVAEGKTCVADMTDPLIVNDNCAAGSVCDNDGADNAWLCRKYCSSDSACGSGKCADVLGSGKWGWCLTPCTAFGSDCPANNSCAVGLGDVDGTSNFFVCKTPGTAKAFEACMLDTDCGANLVCDTDLGYCVPICDATHACTMQPPGDMGTLTCMPYTGITGGGGVCAK